VSPSLAAAVKAAFDAFDGLPDGARVTVELDGRTLVVS
jgi:hypothetical protein